MFDYKFDYMVLVEKVIQITGIILMIFGIKDNNYWLLFVGIFLYGINFR